MDGSFPDEVRGGSSSSSSSEPSDGGTAVADRPAIEELAQEAAAQSPAEPQVVPEGRPHSATVPVESQRSDTDLRVSSEKNGPMGQEAYDLAASSEQAEKAAAESRSPILLEGQRVQVIGGPETGRMAFIKSHVFKDESQAVLFASAAPGKEFAKVDEYVVETRDGRTDTFSVKPDEVKVLEYANGWGRGSI